MILKNATVLGHDFKLIKSSVRIENGKIAEIGGSVSGEKEIDLSEKLILPGFIDSHIHGGIGRLLESENPDLSVLTEYEAKKGVTAIAVTTASVEFQKLKEQLSKIADAAKMARGSKIVAIHAEGPFLNKSKKGGMDEENIILPDVKKLDEMIISAKGLLKIITVAPDVTGAAEFISHAVKRGLTVSMGHTDSTIKQAQEAIKRGATQLTHAFNAMRAYNHREPGILGECLTNPGIVCEVICDYVHLHPKTVELIYRLKGAERINMISDATAVESMPFSGVTANGKKGAVKNGVIVLEDGTISGSAKTLLDGVKNLVKDNYPIEEVSKMASLNPAKSLKIDNLTGSIKVGKLADIVVLDKDYNVEYTFVNGNCVYDRFRNS